MNELKKKSSPPIKILVAVAGVRAAVVFVPSCRVGVVGSLVVMRSWVLIKALDVVLLEHWNC